jgi:hypothetical protein
MPPLKGLLNSLTRRLKGLYYQYTVAAPTLSLLQTMAPIKTAAIFMVSTMAISRLYYLTFLE